MFTYQRLFMSKFEPDIIEYIELMLQLIHILSINSVFFNNAKKYM